MKAAYKKCLDIVVMTCLRSMHGMTRWDTLRKEEVVRPVGVLLELSLGVWGYCWSCP